jgi:hypothetical protein
MTEDEAEARAWDSWREVIGRAAHEAWLPGASSLQADAKPWDNLTEKQRDAIVNSVAGRERFRLAFTIGYRAGRNATGSRARLSEEEDRRRRVLEALRRTTDLGPEEGHIAADNALLDYIDDAEIAEAYGRITKWFA